jgi:hypothetical protein
MRRVALLCAAGLTLRALGLAAQEAESLNVGARLRLKMDVPSARWLVGALIGAAPDSLQLRVADGALPVVVSRRAVTRLELSRNHTSLALRAIRGAGAGLLSGALIRRAG